MPSRPTFAPGAVPGGLAGLGGLPQGEVQGGFLAFVYIDTAARTLEHLFDIALELMTVERRHHIGIGVGYHRHQNQSRHDKINITVTIHLTDLFANQFLIALPEFEIVGGERVPVASYDELESSDPGVLRDFVIRALDEFAMLVRYLPRQ